MQPTTQKKLALLYSKRRRQTASQRKENYEGRDNFPYINKGKGDIMMQARRMYKCGCRLLGASSIQREGCTAEYESTIARGTFSLGYDKWDAHACQKKGQSVFFMM
eukprot:scaffold119002_cov13-Tisochrysis_lutea.AAC.1